MFVSENWKCEISVWLMRLGVYGLHDFRIHFDVSNQSPSRVKNDGIYISKYLTSRFWGGIFVVLLFTTLTQHAASLHSPISIINLKT